MCGTDTHLRTSWSMRSSQLRESKVLKRLRETMHSYIETKAKKVTRHHQPILNLHADFLLVSELTRQLHRKKDTKFLSHWKRKSDRIPRGPDLPVSCCWCVWAVYRGLCRCHDDAAVWSKERSWGGTFLRYCVEKGPDMPYLLSFHPQMTGFKKDRQEEKQKFIILYCTAMAVTDYAHN